MNYYYNIYKCASTKCEDIPMNKSCLLYNLYSGIIESKKKYEVLFIVMIIMFRAVIFTMITSLNFTVMKYVGENNKSEMLKWIIIIALCQCLSNIFQYFENYRYTNILGMKMREYFTKKYYNNLFNKANYDWLNCNNPQEINTAISNGIDALMSTLGYMMDLSLPVVESLGCIYIISTHTGPKIIITLLIMMSVFIIGVKVLEWEYNHQKEINKKTNPLNTYNTDLSCNILTAILNNQGEKTIKIISDNSLRNLKLNREVTNASAKMLYLLQIIGEIMVAATIYYMSFTENVGVLFTINANLYLVYTRMWQLFYMFNNASESAAEWATLEEYLKKVVYEPLHKKTDLREYRLTNKQGTSIPAHSEYHIYGPSGTGKTTWMLNQVIELCREYNPCWMYLEQDMTIPTSSCITIREYLRDYLNSDSDGVDKIILKWAEYLQITSIINKNTLEKSFNTPSGGEKKRINILRMLLPIFTYQSHIKLLFLDEITAGLDDDTHDIVRKLMDKLKNEFNIMVINIDHHTITTPHCRVHIEKTGEGKCPYEKPGLEEGPKKPMKYLQMLDFVNKYINKEEEEEEEPSFPPVVEINRFEIQ